MSQFLKSNAVDTVSALTMVDDRRVKLTVAAKDVVSANTIVSANVSRFTTNPIHNYVALKVLSNSRAVIICTLKRYHPLFTISNDRAAESYCSSQESKTRFCSESSKRTPPSLLHLMNWDLRQPLTSQTLTARSKPFFQASRGIFYFVSRVKTVVCAFVCLLVAGCSALDFTTPKSTSGSETLNFGSEQFSVEAVGTDEPNDIVSHIKVPLQLRSKFVLRRTTQSSGVSQVLEMGLTEVFTDYHLKPLETYTYELGSFENGKFVPAFVKSLTVPQDFVVRGQTTIPEQADHKFQPFRIFIRDRGVLLTSGQSLRIETTEIISDNGTIASFNPAQPAPLNTRGRSGGQLTISAGKLSGHLTVTMRGETGGSGTPGLPGVDYNGTDGMGPTSGTPGSQGAPGGNSGVLHLAIQNRRKDDLTVLVEPGIGGAGGSGGRNGEGNGGGYAPAGLKGYDGQLDPQSEDWK